MTRTTRLSGMFALVAAAVVAIIAPSASAQPSQPILVTDKDDYVPGEIAIIAGAGFWTNEPIDLSISVFNPATGDVINDYQWAQFLADSTGGFLAYYVVPDEAADMHLTATALGLNSGLVATVTFTDTVSSANITSPTSGSPATLTTLPNSLTVNFTYSSAGAAGTTAEVTIPGVGSVGPVPVPTGGTPGSPLSRSLVVPIPAGTANGNYNVQLTIRNTTTPPGPTTRNNNQNGALIVNVPACTATNAPPTLAASTPLNLGDIVPPGGFSVTVPVCVAAFAPVVGDPNGDPVSAPVFAGGLTCVNLTFDQNTLAHTLTLQVTDDPSGRNQPSCPPLPAHTTTFDVVVVAQVYACTATNDPPVITAFNLDLGDICLADGETDLVVPVSPADFNPSAVDPDGDPIGPFALDVSSVTLHLPPDTASQPVQSPVTVSATDNPSAREVLGCPLPALTGSTQVYVTATLHRNREPAILASDANLGQFVGCMSAGSFQTTLPISLATFNASTVDPDGDPVDLSIVGNVSQLTFVGPGLVSLPVDLIATDDPGVRTNGTCAPKTVVRTMLVTAQVIYNFDGFKSPLSNSSATKVKRGSAVPVKFRLLDCSGQQVCDTASGPHVISVHFHQGAAPAGDPQIDDAGSSGDNGVNFRYTDACGLGQWIFNLKTNATYVGNATYRIVANLDDGTTHEVFISIKP